MYVARNPGKLFDVRHIHSMSVSQKSLILIQKPSESVYFWLVVVTVVNQFHTKELINVSKSDFKLNIIKKDVYIQKFLLHSSLQL